MGYQIRTNNKPSKIKTKVDTLKNSNGKSAEAKNTKKGPQQNQKSNKRSLLFRLLLRQIHNTKSQDQLTQINKLRRQGQVRVLQTVLQPLKPEQAKKKMAPATKLKNPQSRKQQQNPQKQEKRTKIMKRRKRKKKRKKSSGGHHFNSMEETPWSRRCALTCEIVSTICLETLPWKS